MSMRASTEDCALRVREEASARRGLSLTVATRRWFDLVPGEGSEIESPEILRSSVPGRDRREAAPGLLSDPARVLPIAGSHPDTTAGNACSSPSQPEPDRHDLEIEAYDGEIVRLACWRNVLESSDGSPNHGSGLGISSSLVSSASKHSSTISRRRGKRSVAPRPSAGPDCSRSSRGSFRSSSSFGIIYVDGFAHGDDVLTDLALS